MSIIFNSIEKGLMEAIEHAEGNSEKTRIHEPFKLDVKVIRKKTQMTQEAFSAAFGISIGTLRHWERGDRTPRGTALVLLNIIDKAPKMILDILQKEKAA
ncbi:MAG: helix-turn-helix domain-containing protein [SAR324 cluster bacterium]|nr:helix-turn-helix domain-containing protein [SAR324 cluster bacterium]